MPNSIQFRDTTKSVNALRRELLPRKFDPTGNYTDRVRARAAGFRLLVHAEIEFCLEQISISAAQRAVEQWNNGKVGLTTVTLLTYASPSNSILSGSVTQLRNLPGVIEELESARDNFVQYAKSDNMGVRRANVRRLLLPVGIPEREIDQAWLQKIDAFGQKRGSLAHSPRGRVRQPVDPKEESDTVSDIVEGIREIDETLKQMRYRALSP